MFVGTWVHVCATVCVHGHRQDALFLCHQPLLALASYPCRFRVFVLQQTNELTKDLLHCLHVVSGAALQDPALPSGQWLQFKVLLDLAAKTESGQQINSALTT